MNYILGAIVIAILGYIGFAVYKRYKQPKV